jgi:hypothetical protein
MVVDTRLAAEPAVRAMNLLDSLADQLTRRNAAPAQDHEATPLRSAGWSQPLREAIAAGRLSCLPEEVG